MGLNYVPKPQQRWAFRDALGDVRCQGTAKEPAAGLRREPYRKQGPLQRSDRTLAVRA
jgi:hypothetical protein